MKSKLPLPHPNNLLIKTKSLAMLDAIYCQQWDLRYFSHNSKWGEKEEMSSMRDGEGDDYFILFSPDGVAMKGCFLEGGLSGEKNLLNKIHTSTPSRFSNFLTEPAFSINEASFVSWFDEQANEWIKIGAGHDEADQDDGSDYLIGWIIGDHNFYWKWASDYYEMAIDISLVKHVFNFLPLDIEYVKRLDANLDENKLLEDIKEIGYPYR